MAGLRGNWVDGACPWSRHDLISRSKGRDTPVTRNATVAKMNRPSAAGVDALHC